MWPTDGILGPMWWLIPVVALVGFAIYNRRQPIFVTRPDGVVAFDYNNVADRDEIHNTVLSYGRTAEGKLDDGTMWVEGEYLTADRAPVNIYQRATQLCHPGTEICWILAYKSDLEAISIDKSPRYMKLFIVDPKFARESGMVGPEGTLAFYA